MYGEKITQLRKNANLTQSQLGDLLNVSAQAVSKWEHNLSEPDLATIKRISSLFNISVDEFLGIDVSNSKDVTTDDEKLQQTIKTAVNEAVANDYGLCADCGCKVNRDNLGSTTPVVLCKDCMVKRKETIKQKEDAENKITEKASDMGVSELKAKKKKSIVRGSITAVVIFILGMLITFSDVEDAGVTTEFFFLSLFLTYASFAYVSEVILDEGPIGDILLWFASIPVRLPGVIFSFDLGGFAFLIIAKIALAIIGFMISVFLFLLGLLVGAVVAPFSYPFTIIKVNKQIKNNKVVEREGKFKPKKANFKPISIMGTELAVQVSADIDGKVTKMSLAMLLGGTDIKMLGNYNLSDIQDIQYTEPSMLKKGVLKIKLKDGSNLPDIEYKEKDMIKQIERLKQIIM